jgi:hypothetical protein
MICVGKASGFADFIHSAVRKAAENNGTMQSVPDRFVDRPDIAWVPRQGGTALAPTTQSQFVLDQLIDRVVDVGSPGVVGIYETRVQEPEERKIECEIRELRQAGQML